MAGAAEAAPIAPLHVGDPGHVEYFDVLIVGAGLSGIGAAYHLQTKCPAKTYAILDGRNAIGGTWDLFRYPGVRSDSDMHTLGYPFRPWRDRKAIADGSSIRKYIAETAQEYGIDRTIRFGHQVTLASWLSRDAAWTVDATGRAPKGRPSSSPATSFACVAATMTTPRAICQAGRAWTGTRAASCTRRVGPRISTMTASELS